MLASNGLELGPIAIDAMPFGPRVMTGAIFEALAEPLANVLGDQDGALAVARDQVGENVPADVDAGFEASVVVAEDAHAAAAAVNNGATVPQLVDAGAGVDARRNSVLPYLPPADTDIDLPFVAPPDPGNLPTTPIPPPDTQTPFPDNQDAPPPPGPPPADVPPPAPAPSPPAAPPDEPIPASEPPVGTPDNQFGP